MKQIDRSVLDLHKAGVSVFGIAKQTGAQEGYILEVLRAKQQGAPTKRMGSRITPADRDEIIAKYLGGKPSTVIARETGRGTSTVLRILKDAGVTRSGTGRPVSEPPPPPAPPAPPAAGILGHLIATKGRWSELAKIAAAQGWSSARAQQEYHRARASA